MVVLGFIQGTWVGFLGVFLGVGLVFGVGCRNDATKMHNVVGNLLNPMQRYEKFLKYANFSEIFCKNRRIPSDTMNDEEVRAHHPTSLMDENEGFIFFIAHAWSMQRKKDTRQEAKR